MPFTREELNGYAENWDEDTRKIIFERIQNRFRRDTLEHFSKGEAALLEAVVNRLIPQRGNETIDLVGFLDWAVGKPFGRGDRPQGHPTEEVLFHKGLRGIQECGQLQFQKDFTALTPEQQDTILRSVQEGTAKGATWQEVSSKHFLTTLLRKALIGYCAHPFAWMRMGFPGPSYPEGYTWITEHEILARKRHFPGWKTL